ncbi:class I SAM-dependent methyltransferase [Microcystis elabens FACHB-917]|nr:class I SAM-dependent methyltransferase [Microcystis elabens FACHB-917]
MASYNFCINTLRQAYARGENITLLLRDRESAEGGENLLDSIEVAYDLQAGSYTEYALREADRVGQYAADIHSLCSNHFAECRSLLDCGTGEMTTLSALSQYLPSNTTLLAFDISLSRVKCGLEFSRRWMRDDLRQGLHAFVAEMGRIPLPTGSIDAVFTSHALEPNRGREEVLLTELLRVACKKLILLEPSYENASREAQQRMDRLGYIRNLPLYIQRCGGHLISVDPIPHSCNNLNPTYCYVVAPPEGQHASFSNYNGKFDDFCCPKSGHPLERKENYWWSYAGGYAYPEIERIPCLRERHAILMTHS